jgi:tRNA pseudouridine38-40 synthase
MPTWKLVVEYEGTRYHGWQSQKNADRTVQGVLIRAARELLGEDAAVGGAGRTDSGVHALAQVAHLRAKKMSTPREIEFGLNDRLPFDVNVLSVEPAAPDFHARHDAVSRTYLYRISRRRTAFDKRLVWWVKDRLDAKAMSEAAALLVGRHDFGAFCENPEGRDSTTVAVTRSDFEIGETELRYRISASHFLWKMVRRIVGTLVEVGRANLSSDALAKLLREHAPGSPAAWTAPPSGLFLESVDYPARRPERYFKSGPPTRSRGEMRGARVPSAPSRPRRAGPGPAGGSPASRPRRGR